MKKPKAEEGGLIINVHNITMAFRKMGRTPWTLVLCQIIIRQIVCDDVHLITYVRYLPRCLRMYKENLTRGTCRSKKVYKRKHPLPSISFFLLSLWPWTCAREMITRWHTIFLWFLNWQDSNLFLRLNSDALTNTGWGVEHRYRCFVIAFMRGAF